MPTPDPFAPSMGPLRSVRLRAGELRYRDAGEGRPVLFLHGLLLHGGFWRHVAGPLRQDVRCVVPDLPLGCHVSPMPRDADLSPEGLADLVAELLEALDLRDAVLVGNDTGGVIAQILAARRPERVAARVLTSCDSFDTFLPPASKYLQVLARIPGGLAPIAHSLRLRPL